MNGTNGIIDLKKLSILAIVVLDSKGRIVIPHKIRKHRSTKYGLYATKDAIILQDLKQEVPDG